MYKNLKWKENLINNFLHNLYKLSNIYENDIYIYFILELLIY